MPHVLETKRLILHLIEPDELISLFEDPENHLIFSGKRFSNPHGVLVKNPGTLRWRVPQVKEDPSLNKWLVRWIVLKEPRVIIGRINFHGKPDGNGMIEVGMEIEPEFQNLGYATEALGAMWLWAMQEPEVRIFRYTVSASNGPSVSVINKFGFKHVGQQIDDEDGPEEIYEMSATEFKNLFQ